MTILNVTQTSGLRLFGLTLNVKNSVVFQYPIQLVVAVLKHASNDKNWLFIPPITLSSFFSIPMQDVKGQSPFLSSSLHPNLPPLPTSQFPQSTLVRRRPCLLIHPLVDLLNFMEDWSSGTLRRSLAARHPLPQLKPDPSLRHIGTKEPHSALCPVNMGFKISLAHSKLQ